MPYVCRFCKGRFCAAHRLPENHDCQGLGAYKERLRAEGRVFAPEQESLVTPRVSRTAQAGASLDRVWAKVDGKMTYVFLGIMAGVYLLERITLPALGEDGFLSLWAIKPNFLVQPWTIVTSVFAHSLRDLNHLLFNGLALYFFGTVTERLIGTKRFTYLFLSAGMVAGIAQVLLMKVVFNVDSAALGASGAIQGVMGTLVVLAPTLTVLVFFVIPAPLWALAIVFVLLDLVGFISPGGTVANAAHLAGFAIGLAFGYRLRQKGLRAVVRKQSSPWRFR